MSGGLFQSTTTANGNGEMRRGVLGKSRSYSWNRDLKNTTCLGGFAR